MNITKHFEVVGNFDEIIKTNDLHFDFKYFKSIFEDEIGIFMFRKDRLNPFTHRYSELPQNIILGFYITDIGSLCIDGDSHNVVKDKTDFFVLNRIPEELKKEIIDSFEKYYDSGIYMELNSRIDDLRNEIYKIPSYIDDIETGYKR